MRSKSDKELQKVTMNLFKGDYEELQSLYPDLGAGPVIREIIHNFLARAKAETVTIANPPEIKI